MLELMLPAFVASLVLVGMHGYLGLHVIARGVIFVDLALAQVAALGFAAGELGVGRVLRDVTGLAPEIANYILGLSAALIAAALFSVSRTEHRYVPQEAIIGIVYVVAGAGTILLAAQAPRGSEHVEELLTGHLLWVTWPQIWSTAVLYAAIGIVHWFLRKRFFTISLSEATAIKSGWRVAWWDFLFYALFGIVVTRSVSIAGVLLVFSFLVIPAVIAFLFTLNPARLLAIAWTSGILAATLGLYGSYRTDLPTGPVIVCAYAVVLVLAFGISGLLRKRGPLAASGPADGADAP